MTLPKKWTAWTQNFARCGIVEKSLIVVFVLFLMLIYWFYYSDIIFFFLFLWACSGLKSFADYLRYCYLVTNFTFYAKLSAEVISRQIIVHKITSKGWIHYSWHSLYVKRIGGGVGRENLYREGRNLEGRIPDSRRSMQSYFWPTPGLTEGTVPDSHWAKETYIYFWIRGTQQAS